MCCTAAISMCLRGVSARDDSQTPDTTQHEKRCEVVNSCFECEGKASKLDQQSVRNKMETIYSRNNTERTERYDNL
jgi:hypothetical protein